MSHFTTIKVQIKNSEILADVLTELGQSNAIIYSRNPRL